MIDFMEQLYDDFIAPHVRHQPKDYLYTQYFDEYEQYAAVEEKDRSDMIRKFYAIHAFILGLKMGLALSEDLKAPG